mmetsp:Transcript_9410/g.12370  ORF Transcript_9410/g.12370 Transcript_9410/m.12370 type:complete len:310 (+) Transcript_9410:127-1056(+)
MDRLSLFLLLLLSQLNTSLSFAPAENCCYIHDQHHWTHCPNFCPTVNESCASLSSAKFALKGLMKSGTTWLEYIIESLLMDAKSLVDKFSATKCGKRRQSPKIQLWWGSGKEPKVDFSYCNEDKHGPFQDSNLYIWVIRDPRDVMVSAYYYFGYAKKKFNGAKRIPEQYALNATRNTGQAIKVRFEKAKNRRQATLIVRYEELNQKSFHTLQQIHDFLRLKCITPLGKSFADQIYNGLSFNSMAKMEKRKGLYGTGRNRKKMRSGQNFQYRREFDHQTLARIDGIIQNDPFLNSMFETYREAVSQEQLE